MGATKYREKLYGAVHKKFADVATYTLSPAAPIDITARLLRGNEMFGDLDREGYAEVVQDVIRIVFQRSQVVPAEKAVVTFEDGSQYRVKFVRPAENDSEIVAEVTPV